jgi:uncharacterized protein (DUF1697 family)
MSGWGGGGLVTKLKNERDALRAKVEAAFLKQYGCSAQQYVTNAEQAAVISPTDIAKQRSSQGKAWMLAPPQAAHPQPSINEYHDLEEQAKAAVTAGNIPLAIQRLEDANRVQTEYEDEHFGGADSGHDTSKNFRLSRRASLGNINQALIQADPNVAKAKLAVTQFFSKSGVQYYG